MYGQCLVSNGAYNSCNSNNNSYYGYPTGTQEVAVFLNNVTPSIYITGVTDGRPCVITSSGKVTLSNQPALDFSNPHTGIASPRVGPLFVCYDGENRNNWVHFFDFWIDPQSEDLRYVASSTSNNSVLFTPVIAPALYTTGATGYVNPYASGAVWSLVTNAGPYVGGSYGINTSRYLVNGSTGAVSVRTVPSAGTVDVIGLLVTATNGTLYQEFFYIVWV